jgi:hypothetical protein
MMMTMRTKEMSRVDHASIATRRSRSGIVLFACASASIKLFGSVMG